MRTIDFGNNETMVVGVDRNADGTFTALTLTESKSFKTAKGAERWLAARGYRADGQKVAA